MWLYYKYLRNNRELRKTKVIDSIKDEARIFRPCRRSVLPFEIRKASLVWEIGKATTAPRYRKLTDRPSWFILISRHGKSNPIELNFNRTQSNSIHGLSSIQFGNRTKWNSSKRKKFQSNQIERSIFEFEISVKQENIENP